MEEVEAQIYENQVFTGARSTYTVGKRLGDGGFAGVFAATEDATGRSVAVKVLAFHGRPADAELEFDGERALLGMLTGCSNVATLLDHGQFEFQMQVTAPTGVPIDFPARSPFMVLELAQGSLDELLADRHKIAWDRKLLLFREVAKGVHQMHLKKMVHRDVKAENALTFSQSPYAKITDLGRSKDTQQAPRFLSDDYLTGRGDIRFAPPEFVWGLGTDDALDQWRGDLYHLGSLLYEIATATGITSAALGDPIAVIYNHVRRLGSFENRLLDFEVAIPELREQYEPMIEAFALELPPAIRMEATQLLRQLVNPDPTGRVPVKPLGELPIYWDLQWLLIRVDIMIKRLAADTRARAKLAERRKRRRRRRKVGVIDP
jgi:eukaryotic-like serine/threonine-protein kinase